MFPGPGANIYRNEAGEPTGWDYPAEPDEADVADAYYDRDPQEEEDLDDRAEAEVLAEAAAEAIAGDLLGDLGIGAERLRSEAARLAEDLGALDEQARRAGGLDLTPAARDDLDAVLAELAAVRETLR